ncbi:sterol carrier protein domain-containing protein, partial [Enterococcus faecium]|uniref:sterol carrier protein domain-containing protein n=1 Tax=Enterococcus faecium TaxID=1352 RepID=UPI003CC5AAC2
RQNKEQIEPYFMARIVDVQEFLQRYPFVGTDDAFHFIIEDPVAPRNNGVFAITWDEQGQVRVLNQPIGKSVRLDIET